MCKAASICVAISLIIVGFLILAGGIIALITPKIIDCDELTFSDDLGDFCDEYEDVLKIAGGVGTAVGGVLFLVGIIILCIPKSRSRPVVHAVPATAMQIQHHNVQNTRIPPEQPNNPYYNQQYQQQQHHNPYKNPLADQSSAPPPAYEPEYNQHHNQNRQYYNPPAYQNHGYEKGQMPQGLPRAHMGPSLQRYY
ncbi:hypothetical protein SK128_002533 [Halocaridina rubra]|uniref:Uncharacterized protein n=1 Tax=Halocaridina rubra TaxID=373956 RepID=A0AAN8XTY7_HALRR